jgi:hypothetical protein
VFGGLRGPSNTPAPDGPKFLDAAFATWVCGPVGMALVALGKPFPLYSADILWGFCMPFGIGANRPVCGPLLMWNMDCSGGVLGG